MNYDELIERLLSVNMHGGIKLGLDNCIKLNAALDFPSSQFPAVHIAGTNGKGSVATKIAAAFQISGKKVGLYTSPHIACFRERIRINGEMISEQDVTTHLSKLFTLTEALQIPATFFELTTLLAFNHFANEKVDIAILETGLGGRLDATNIANSILSIITSIGLDHTDILGATIEEIAREKAGIIKPAVPVLLGPHMPKELLSTLAAEKSSPCFTVDGAFDNFQDENNAIAESALRHMQVPEEAIDFGLNNSPPCRMQIWNQNQLAAIFPNKPLPKALILDVAHNPDGLNGLIKRLKQQFPTHAFRFILGLSKNKDIASCLNLIAPVAAYIHLPASSMPRVAPSHTLKEVLLDLGYASESIVLEASVETAIIHAVTASTFNEIVIVCGTFFIMAEARQTLGIFEPQDTVSLNETFKK